ncbi:MAG: hypothetical protein ABSE49_00315 [Polyangiaceae bacterium]|jgi:hypothetical protein
MSGDLRVWMALAAVAGLAALVQTARLAWAKASRAWALRDRAARGAEGEARAEKLLRAAGYSVVARQAAGSWTVHSDGAPLEVGLRADYIVARDGRRFVAEVKTGRLAPRLETAATRRQLLEYRFAFEVDGVLLVDADAARVSAIEFASHHSARSADAGGGSSARWLVALVVGAALGAGIVTALH